MNYDRSYQNLASQLLHACLEILGMESQYDLFSANPLLLLDNLSKHNTRLFCASFWPLLAIYYQCRKAMATRKEVTDSIYDGMTLSCVLSFSCFSCLNNDWFLFSTFSKLVHSCKLAQILFIMHSHIPFASNSCLDVIQIFVMFMQTMWNSIW